MYDLTNKIVLITGANNPHGIGAETARAFAQAGAKVAITYLRLPSPDDTRSDERGTGFYNRQRAKSSDEVLDSLARSGLAAIAKEADLSDHASIPMLFDWVEQEFGPVDVLVNNASHFEPDGDTIFEITAEGMDRTFSVNVRAAILMIQELVERHKSRNAHWGRVVNVSTDAAQSFSGQISYGASKAAIESLTRSIAGEVGPLGITVNAIAPGPVQTGYISTEAEQQLRAEIPMGRIGKPEDIASAIVYFASDEASWVTGQVVRVSGGHVF